MKRFLLPIGFLCLIGVFVFTLVKTSNGRFPSLAVPKTSPAVVSRGCSFGVTGGDFPSVDYRNYRVEYSASCNPGGGQAGTNVRGFCQTDEPAGELMDGGRYSWTMPDNTIGSGEFKGVIQYLEENIRRMLEGPDVITMLNGMLCGQGAHAASSSSVSGVDACAAADLCVFDAGKGRFKRGGSTPSNCAFDSITTQTGCYGSNSGGGDGTIYYDSDGNGTTDTTWTTLNDGWLVYANKGEVKIWWNQSEQKIEALIALWGDSQAKRIPPLPPVGYGWDQNDPGTTSESGARNWDRVCVEATVKLCENNPGNVTPNRCPGATGECGAVFVTSSLNLYADALVIKTKMSIKQDANNKNLIDVCPDFDPSTGKPSITTTWLELVDQDIEPNLTVDLGIAGCTCNVDPDASFPPDTLNEQLAGLVFDFLSNFLHGTCEGNVNFCNMPTPTPLFGCDGSNCVTSPWDERCDPCDNDCDNISGVAGGDINESMKGETDNYCDWCDRPDEKMDNPQGGQTTGWNYCVRGVPPPTGTGPECSVGLFPMDLNNALPGLLFGTVPVSINDPEYSSVAPNYGTIELFGVKYDLGCYPQSFDIRSYGCYSTIDAAIYPRWSEYELCADIAEVGEYPNKTNPPPFYVLPATTPAVYGYHFMIGLNQDLATEIAYSLYVSSLACNVFDKNSIICDLFGFFGGDSSEECPFMKVSTQRSVTPGLKIADPDCYVELRMRPAGSPSVRTGAMSYSVTWPVGYPIQITSGVYDGALFVPNFFYEVRAPLDDGIPGVCSNPPVTVLVYDTNGWGGLNIEYINLYHPAFPDRPGYLQIFLDIGFHLNEIRYSAEYGLSPVEQKDSVNQFIGLITNIYLATLMNFRIQLPFISDPSDPLTIKFITARPSIVGTGSGREQEGDALDYLPGAWPENTAGDYLAIYGVLEGTLNLFPLIQSLGLFSPPETRNLEEIEKLYPETFIRLPQWGEDGLSTYIELSPYDTARLFENHTISFNISSYSHDTPSDSMRYTYRLNNGLWSVPKEISNIKLSYLPDGYYRLEVAAIGNKQRMDSTPAVVNFVVDRTPPRVEPMEKKTIVRDEVYRLPVFIDDNMTKRENLKTRFRVDNGEWVEFNPRLKYLDIPLKTKGLHDIEIEVYDEAGNRGFYKQGVFRAEKLRGFSCGFVVSTIKGYAGFFLATLLSVGIPLLFLIGIKVGLKRKEAKNRLM